ncbi:hypothetical protein J4U01_gp041 [Mycobacterium phage Kumao]|uniref:Uncharacterized protein n=1 Tax=Mycobacterium phage Kumao TaxID=2041344 RepID=A0A2D1GPT2_9CAUD|nr:hypothetical protein J4U01_gp041 [Mycobacterium phage Kumao]ATN94004.1 hypothetical protein SEA_KUMAO_41 [Mycobacterium phage Kumao]
MAADFNGERRIREGQRVSLDWADSSATEPITGVVDKFSGGFVFVKLDKLYRNSGYAAARVSQVKPL